MPDAIIQHSLEGKLVEGLDEDGCRIVWLIQAILLQHIEHQLLHAHAEPGIDFGIFYLRTKPGFPFDFVNRLLPRRYGDAFESRVEFRAGVQLLEFLQREIVKMPALYLLSFHGFLRKTLGKYFRNV